MRSDTNCRTDAEAGETVEINSVDFKFVRDSDSAGDPALSEPQSGLARSKDRHRNFLQFTVTQVWFEDGYRCHNICPSHEWSVEVIVCRISACDVTLPDNLEAQKGHSYR